MPTLSSTVVASASVAACQAFTYIEEDRLRVAIVDTAYRQVRLGEEARMTDKLVTVDWVEEHKGDPNVRLVEVDVDTEAYATGHIEGAVGWNWTSQLQDQVARDIASKEELSRLVSEAGIGPDTHIVLYGDNNNWFAAYALWLLELYGHDNASLMD